MNLDIPGLTNESMIFLRPNLCPYFNKLAFNCRVLRRHELISKVVTSDEGVVKIKTLDNKFIKLTHETDLILAFPNFKHFNFNDY